MVCRGRSSVSSLALVARHLEHSPAQMSRPTSPPPTVAPRNLEPTRPVPATIRLGTRVALEARARRRILTGCNVVDANVEGLEPLDRRWHIEKDHRTGPLDHQPVLRQGHKIPEASHPRLSVHARHNGRTVELPLRLLLGHPNARIIARGAILADQMEHVLDSVKATELLLEVGHGERVPEPIVPVKHVEALVLRVQADAYFTFEWWRRRLRVLALLAACVRGQVVLRMLHIYTALLLRRKYVLWRCALVCERLWSRFHENDSPW
mmetsp:Transcript_5063/g.15048  ORF Transcript_5063/g.15048 Transcript_5063/m.15048 type:complete len:265 (+) Transcript_5063:381-1175(+)